MKLTKQQQNCPYCHGKKKLRSEDNDSQRLVIYDDQALNLEECVVHGTYMTEHGEELNFGWKTTPFLINFCPMCGRNLNEEEE